MSSIQIAKHSTFSPMPFSFREPIVSQTSNHPALISPPPPDIRQNRSVLQQTIPLLITRLRNLPLSGAVFTRPFLAGTPKLTRLPVEPWFGRSITIRELQNELRISFIFNIALFAIGIASMICGCFMLRNFFMQHSFRCQGWELAARIMQPAAGVTMLILGATESLITWCDMIDNDSLAPIDQFKRCVQCAHSERTDKVLNWLSTGMEETASALKNASPGSKEEQTLLVDRQEFSASFAATTSFCEYYRRYSLEDALS